MSVNLVVQDDAGDIANANGYIAVADFATYCANRLYVIASFTSDQQSAAIIMATDYLDTRFTFKGVQKAAVLQPIDPTTGAPFVQTTQWPRAAGNTETMQWWDVEFATSIGTSPFGTANIGEPVQFVPLSDPNGNPIIGIPQAVKDATCEYAFRVLLNIGGGTGGSLFQDAPAPDGGWLIRQQDVQVDVIRQNLIYEPRQPGAFAMPAYPPADLKLARAGLIVTGRELFR